MGVEVAFDGGEYGALDIVLALVAADRRQAEVGQDRRQIHVLELNGAVRPPGARHQVAGVVSLDVGTARQFCGQHGEIGRDDGVEFVGLPVGSYF
ncbi:hypothetical protein [Brevundimonas sp. P7753]|uniref:hypothetical protein n=1 Tax=Brevundimonas sp. P7753 TaxID=2726982 RepID=UPI0015BC9DD4|nr:hypothetical protein [Brevundimonas sp. P7753]NWE54005.1 hypothetical protein [Brevundimonas sp. P7753]